MAKKNKNRRTQGDSAQRDNVQHSDNRSQKNVSSQDYDHLTKEVDVKQTKKPGSQSPSGGSGRHNNGRGGGK